MSITVGLLTYLVGTEVHVAATSPPAGTPAASEHVRAAAGPPATSTARTGDTDAALTAASVVVSKAPPVRLEVPSIGVDAPVVGLGLEPDGALEVPSDFDQTGWYRDGPEPGEAGSAVIVGHVDSTTGPAAFFRLRELTVGDEVIVHHADGTATTFVVEGMEQHDKEGFPTERVFGGTDEVGLRLITCGGPFDRTSRSYEDNVVVFGTAGLTTAGGPAGRPAAGVPPPAH